MDIYAHIVQLLVTKFEVDPDDVKPDASFEDLALDSLHLMEMSLSLSSALGAAIDEGVLRPEQTIEEASHAVTTAAAGTPADTAAPTP